MKNTSILTVLVLIAVSIVLFLRFHNSEEDFIDSDELKEIESDVTDEDVVSGTYDDLDSAKDNPACKMRYTRGVGFGRRHSSHVRTH